MSDKKTYRALLVSSEPGREFLARSLGPLEISEASEKEAHAFFAYQAKVEQSTRREFGQGHKAQMVRYVWLGGDE